MRAHLVAAVLVAGALASGAAPVQKSNDPASCPYCKGEPALMEKAGIVSHGGFEFGDEASTEKVDAVLASAAQAAR